MNADKKKILIFMDYFLPGYQAGGPITSIYHLVQALHHHYDFFIVTRGHDYQSHENYNEPMNQWIEKPSYKVFYAGGKAGGLPILFKRIIAEISPSLIYLNSFFSVNFSFYIVLLRYFFCINAPILLAPRGELQPGALSLKQVKKKIYLNSGRCMGLYRKVYWHATSQAESEFIRRHFSQARPFTVANMPVVIPEHFAPLVKQSGSVRIVFYSRIDRKKNLSYAIDVLSQLTSDVIQFDIIGPVSHLCYWQSCLNQIKKLPDNIMVNYLGGVSPEKKIAKLSNYHACFLPTLGENYGHAIVEAMAAGCIPIISDQTPWLDLEQERIGWSISLANMHKYVTAIDRLVQMTQFEFDAYRFRLLHYLKSHMQLQDLKKQYQSIFESIMKSE